MLSCMLKHIENGTKKLFSLSNCEAGNEQARSSFLDTSQSDNASGSVDRLANFLEKPTPTLSSFYTVSNLVALEDALPLPKAASKKIILEKEVKQEYMPTFLFVTK